MVESFYRPIKSYYEEFNILPLLNRNSSGQSSTFITLPEARTLKIFLSVTAFGGTNPTLDLAIEEVWDLSNQTNNFISLGAFSQKTGTANDVLSVTIPFVRKFRANYGIGGTAGPNFTFKVDAVARS